MMNESGDDLVERSLAMLGEETDEIWAAGREARLMASIANLKTDSGEQARIDGIAAQAGIETDEGDDAPLGDPGNVAPPQAVVTEPEDVRFLRPRLPLSPASERDPSAAEPIGTSPSSWRGRAAAEADEIKIGMWGARPAGKPPSWARYGTPWTLIQRTAGGMSTRPTRSRRTS